MKDSVIIKSYQNGLTLILDDSEDFGKIIREIEFKFSESRTFFGDAKMALSIEGRDVSEKEELQIIDAVTSSCDITVTCLVGKDERTDKFYLKAIRQAEKHSLLENDGQMRIYQGTLKDRQVFESESGILVVGDVNPGCRVISGKDIIVIGGLYGEAYAGEDGRRNHYILALEMQPERLKIADIRCKEPGKNKWGFHMKVQPKIAFLNGENFEIQVLTRELLNLIS